MIRGQVPRRGSGGWKVEILQCGDASDPFYQDVTHTL